MVPHGDSSSVVLKIVLKVMKMREKRKKWSLMGIPPLIGCGRRQRRLLLPQHATFMFSSISTCSFVTYTCTFVTYTFTFVFTFTTDYSILNTHHTPFSILLSQHGLLGTTLL